MASKAPAKCPSCGSHIPPRALSCPECGADEDNGWGMGDIYDGLDLPDEAFQEHDDRLTRRKFEQREAGAKRIAWILLIAFLFPLLSGLVWLMVK